MLILPLDDMIVSDGRASMPIPPSLVYLLLSKQACAYPILDEYICLFSCDWELGR